MFRSLALEAVWKEQDKTSFLFPLVLRRRNVLIDDHLSPVREIAELSLPQDQIIWTRNGIAIFKTENAGFRQRAVINIEACPRFFFISELGQRRPALAGH